MTEERKIHLIQAIAVYNDEFAFDELVRFYFPGLVSFASNILKDVQQAEEAVEDVFIKLWHNRTTLVSIKNFSHYIYTATKYTAISALRTRKAILYDDFSEDFPLSYDEPESAYISKENVQTITKAINSLPPKCRLIFRLIKEERMKYDEVAQLLQISVKTVESQMHIAIKKLATALQTSLPELLGSLAQKKI
ncbi:RNA polymerase sigma factor [Niabella insulamsoli]|uniref:RNA polymerase sigma factor n=1 Tax=Niabella insulamsoli TaxID=3144874 RepID=UPI0031FC667F